MDTSAVLCAVMSTDWTRGSSQVVGRWPSSSSSPRRTYISPATTAPWLSSNGFCHWSWSSWLAQFVRTALAERANGCAGAKTRSDLSGSGWQLDTWSRRDETRCSIIMTSRPSGSMNDGRRSASEAPICHTWPRSEESARLISKWVRIRRSSSSASGRDRVFKAWRTRRRWEVSILLNVLYALTASRNTSFIASRTTGSSAAEPSAWREVA
mmetsp:Transcript_17002/g.29422  ORF Transcript_17002/g.29422 Transcript_17002/m.29422 type:complete len:211 (-) Transcript_17002:208-840(-)